MYTQHQLQYMERKAVMKQWDRLSRQYSESRDADGPETELIDELIYDLPQNPKILDIGCGDAARTLQNLPKGSVGLDISRRGIELAEQNTSNHLVQSDMLHLPFKKDTFDGITAYFSVFHVHRTEHPEVYDEFARVIKPGGKILKTLPNGRYHTVRNGWMGGKMLFSTPGKEQSISMMQDSGFEGIRTKISNDPLGGSTEFVFAERS